MHWLTQINLILYDMKRIQCPSWLLTQPITLKTHVEGIVYNFEMGKRDNHVPNFVLTCLNFKKEHPECIWHDKTYVID